MDDFEPCTYCGLPATTIDHVPPVSARDRIIESGIKSKYPFKEVPACKECNSSLGAKGWTIGERKLLVKERLRRKYAKYLRIPSWTDEEIQALGPSLQAHIRGGLEVQRVVKRRLSH